MLMKWSFILFLPLASFQSAREVKVYVDYAKFEQDYLLNKSNDTTYVINFWATWCRPCVQELPYFEQLAKDSMVRNIQ